MMDVYRAAGSTTAFSYSCTCDDRYNGPATTVNTVYSLTKHNIQTTYNPAGATARTAIRLTRETQSPLRTPAGNRLQTSSARVQDFLYIHYSRVTTHTIFRLPRATVYSMPAGPSLTPMCLSHRLSPDCPSSYTTFHSLLCSHSNPIKLMAFWL